MPELPEVETTRLGISQALVGKKITNVIVRHYQLRFPVPKHLKKRLVGQVITTIKRRGKYLLFVLEKGTFIIHLGMSGSLRLLESKLPPGKHDHADIVCGEVTLRLNDPRRFGALLYTPDAPENHVLLKHLGAEPLSQQFRAKYLYERIRHKKTAIKVALMDSKIVVGVGNIYAAEALFLARIHPQRIASHLTLKECEKLMRAIKVVLKAAILRGGTTIQNFSAPSGKPGYFTQRLQVYDRAHQPCYQCGKLLVDCRLAKRQTVFCARCQQ